MIEEADDIRQAPSLSYWFKGTLVDRVLLVLAVLTIIVAWQWLYQNLSGHTPMVFVYHDDELLAKYPLNPDQPIHYIAKGSEGESEIVIDKEGVRVVHSSCTSKHCVRSGVHHHVGDVIACIPNHILVTILGAGHDSFDAVVE
ncbi:MAG: hypothetical protein CO186_02415 [Zetaproteobacteria bacterium CG_4_9_14_3_um_filter_49_83]|nr:MAG: hypothetical protein AUJ56_06460 [Zetaproteobacteria bacterium CG1_02_49_23]PIQ33501.1 MAG: hypothetical protein COW62_05180 [Zetaproteobacteria bacterium CG17_big_fil_post_rev_8_21_14_2_50_50_13]PIV30335.1 MAG: hypothetical protein COS35_07315 [Zetaproteobacteria bacterium CG02_land_8_20_14_3_00_50_9]PIY55709.1 MAG: hypothetical protein COZ00_08245 [Zetaproteobacteria bacterium CG_4_10_14_0_8_um_filter_49_80]PJA36017.1 MAG: hypothetical protein CO186_02415 [Zetaproteobacteria bacterium